MHTAGCLCNLLLFARNTYSIVFLRFLFGRFDIGYPVGGIDLLHKRLRILLERLRLFLLLDIYRVVLDRKSVV